MIKVCTIDMTRSSMSFKNTMPGLKYSNINKLETKSSVTDSTILSGFSGIILYWNNNPVAVLFGMVNSYSQAGTMATYLSNDISNGILIKETSNFSPSGTTTIDIHSEITANYNLAISATNIDSLSVNGSLISDFPKTLSISNDTTMNIVGKNPNHAVTLANKNNLKSVKIDDTTYNNFPVAVTIGADKTLEISGKDTPEITVNYTNTKPPVITNT